MSGQGFDLALFEHPFKGATDVRVIAAGSSLQDVADACGITNNPHMIIRVSAGACTSTVPAFAWPLVKPKTGSVVEVYPAVHGAAIGAILTAVVGTAAPALAGALFPGLAAGSFGLSIATAAITVVGTLLVRALIPPPSTSSTEEETVYTITGASNSAAPYDPYPTVLGRHIMFPKKTATGYTETVEDEIYLRERMTFGHGPVALETLKIGTTDITEFDDVQLEFLNVDKDRTLANMPDLANLITPKTSEATQPNFLIEEPNDRYTFTTELAAKSATVDLSPVINDFVSSYEIRLYSRAVGATNWTQHSVHANVTGDLTLTWPEFSDNVEREFSVKMQSRQTQNETGLEQGSEGETIPFTTENTGVSVQSTSAEYQDGLQIGGWRYGTEAMTLYPDDVSEDTYNVTLDHNLQTVRQTRVEATSAQVDIAFQGLVQYDSKGRAQPRTALFLIEYRLVGDTAWTVHETKTCTESTGQYVRFTSEIDFQEVGQYDIRITRQTEDTDDSKIRDSGTLTAIRTFQSGGLPSHDGISEVVLRIKATSQLNGQIQNLNAVVQQLAPVWDGSAWSDPVPVRHPAHVFTNALRGQQMRDTVADSRIDLNGLKAWADEEPWWTCDTVIEGTRRLADVLDLIAATGRARRGFNDLKYSVIRDGGAGGIVQHFTPRNSWGFVGRRFLDREIHGFRIRAVSERKEWAEDDVIVYADGFGPANATEFETLPLPAVVLTNDGDNQGNPWRLGRYHLAVAKLRPEEFHFYSDLDHLRCQMGSKVRVVHDVPMFGVGAARVIRLDHSGGFVQGIFLDDIVTEDARQFRMRIRAADSTEITFAATNDGSGGWTPVSQVPVEFEVGDLVLIEETTAQAVDLLVTNIQNDGDLKAKITAVPAAPAVLQADGGQIPAYDPQITPQTLYGPEKPVVAGVRSGLDTAILERDGSLTPRIGVEIAAFASLAISEPLLQVRWRAQASTRWNEGAVQPYASELLTGPLEGGSAYYVAVRSLDQEGKTRGWVDAGLIVAASKDALLAAPVGWASVSGIDTVTLFGPETSEQDVAGYVIYAANSQSATLTAVGQTVSPHFMFRPADSEFSRYRIGAIDHDGTVGDLTAFIAASPTGVTNATLTTEVDSRISAALAGANDAASEAVAARAIADAVAGGLADLEGFATSTASLTADLSNGKIAGIRATVYDGDGGATTGSILELLGDNVVAPGSLSASSLVITDTTGNFWPNAAFKYGDNRGFGNLPAPWSIVQQGSNTFDPVQDAVSQYILQIGPDATQRNWFATTPIDVKGGESFEISCDLARDEFAGLDPEVRLVMSFVDAAGTYVGGNFVPFVPTEKTWQRFTKNVTAPANAARVNLSVRKYAAASSAFAFVANIEAIRKRSGATLITPYSITSEAALFAEAAIGTLEIAQGAVTVESSAYKGTTQSILSNDTWQTVNLVTINKTLAGFSTRILVSMVTAGASVGNSLQFRIMRGPVEVRQFHKGLSGTQDTVTHAMKDNDLQQGLFTYYLQAKAIGGNTLKIYQSYIAVEQTKR